MARRGLPRPRSVSRRPRLTVESLEARLTPSFSLRAPASPEDLKQIEETRAGMYTPLDAIPPSPTGAAADLDLRAAAPVRINLDDLTAHLAETPAEFEPGVKVFAVPRPDGTFDRFRVWEVELMEPGLAAEFPAFRTWRGQGIDDPTATLAASLTSLGFHAQVLGPNGRWAVDPFYHLETDVYAAYYQHDLVNRHAASWAESLLEHEHEHEGDVPPVAGRQNNGQTLRTYRTAVAATGEYTAFFGGTVTNGQAAIVTAINRVSQLFETELAIRLVLVNNNSLLVYTNAGTDPYSNTNGGAMLSQNQSTVDSVIGNANYDLGHVFSTGGGGVAYLGVVGQPGWKAAGVTGQPTPVGDPFYVDYVIHEMGHQFGGNHTFNGTNGNAAGNVNGPTAYEPGSGSTIMAYAGICGPDDLQPNSDPYFHAASLNEISDYIFTGWGAGNTQTATGNNIPTADAGPDYTIPARTPFALTGSATDADPGDVLTYNWEQYDRGAAQALSAPDNGTSPLFRSLIASTSPTRTFPRLANVLANTTTTSEELPSVAQTMTFRLTVRDNRTTGAYNRDDMNVVVQNTGAAFAITSHNAAATLVGASTPTITWNVAGTNLAPINTSLVNLLLSTDGGQTFPITLAAGTANDGSETVTLPNLSSNQVRIKVQPVGNIYFDISNANLTIVPTARVTAVTSPAADGVYGIGAVIPIRVTYDAAVDVTGTPRLALNSGGTADYVGGSGTATLTFNYTVAGGQNAADLDYASTAALSLNGGSIAVASNGNTVDLALPAPGGAGSLGASSNLVIDTTTAPRVTAVDSSLANGTYGAGTVVPITVTFHRPVVVTGAPRLTLNTGGVAGYVGGSGTTELTFQYTVGPTDETGDLDYASTAALSANGGTLTDQATGAGANLTLPVPGSAGSLGANADLVIGIARLSLSGTTFTGAEGDTVSVTVERTGSRFGVVSVPYTVTTRNASATDFVVQSAPDALTWASGDTAPKSILIHLVNDQLSEGREWLTITLGTPPGPTELGTAAADLRILQSDGRTPGSYGELADGDVATIRVFPPTGAGTVLVYLTDDQSPISLIETVNTDPARTVVSVTVRKARNSVDGGTVPIGGVIGTGVKALYLPRTPLTAEGVQLTGPVQSLRLDSLLNGADVVLPATPVSGKSTRLWMRAGAGDGSDVVVNAPLAGFNVGSFGNGRIESPSVGALRVRGNFGGTVQVSGVGLLTGLPALRSLWVGGAATGSRIDVAGRVTAARFGSFVNSRFDAASLGTMTVRGPMSGDLRVSGVGVDPLKPTLGTLRVLGTADGARIDAGGRVGSVMVGSFWNSHLYAGYTGDEVGNGAFDPTGWIGSFRATAATGGYRNSSLIAAQVGTVSLASVDADNGDDKFGVYADLGIGKVTVRVPALLVANLAAAAGVDDFEVKVIG